MAKMKECFGIELANRFFTGAFNVVGGNPEERQKNREECYGCPDFEHCARVLDVVYQLRMVEETKRSSMKPSGQMR